ncbi:MAG: HigA family addiction module antidote protein [Nitrospinae bacterium]|nr:HigA family addiction module antidote protein [Nitrospinota bacterium]
MAKTIFPPVSPGRILKEEFMAPLGITQNGLARAIDVPPNRINDILQARRVITVASALRLARYFHNTPGFWMNLQSHYEIECAKEKSGKAIRAIKPLRRTALQAK